MQSEHPENSHEMEYGLGQFASPGAIAHQLLGELVACWRCLPADGRTPDAAIADAREAFARSLEWWNALPQHSTDAIAMALHAGLEQPDLDNIEVESTAEAYESLQKYNRDSSLRQAFFTCWCILPEDRRDAAKVSGIMRDICERTIANFREDAERFGA